ncbi:MAG: insulinase family protein [Fimbriimonadia bacterium]|nr:insulinase family protein [Fimbriimonadia bacterium]
MNIFTVVVPNSHWTYVSYVVHSGSVDDPWRLPGLAHLTEHMVVRNASNSKKRISLESQLATMGGYFDAYTTLDKTVYNFAVPSERFQEVLALAVDLSENLEYSQEDWLLEHNVVHLQMMSKNEYFDVSQHLRGLVWGRKAKSARPIIGVPLFLHRVKHSDVNRFWRKHYTSNNCSILCLAPTKQIEDGSGSANFYSQKTTMDFIKPTASFVRRKDWKLIAVSLNWLIDAVPCEISTLSVISNTLEQILIDRLRLENGLVDNIEVSFMPDPLRLCISTSTRATWLDPLIWCVLDSLNSLVATNEWVPLVKGISKLNLEAQRISPMLDSCAYSIIRYGIHNYHFENDLDSLENLACGEPSTLENLLNFLKYVLRNGVLYGIVVGEVDSEQNIFVKERIESWAFS